jgi:hypothetical protein
MQFSCAKGNWDYLKFSKMPEPDTKRDLEALIKAMEENRAELKKTQQKVVALEAAIKVVQDSRLESEEKRAKRNPN